MAHLLRNIGLIGVILASITGCKNEGCTEFTAENYDPEAVINDGSCIEVRDKFLGNFAVIPECGLNNYIRIITGTQNKYVVVISNIADTLGTVEARISGENITIDRQLVQASISVIHDCLEWCSKL